jgi:hypothetical protein
MFASVVRVVLALVGAVFLLTDAPAVSAQESGYLAYSAKYVCGDRQNDNAYAVAGRYRTVINVHNPHYLPAEGILVFKKAVWARTQRERGTSSMPTVSGWVPDFLPPDDALAVDCEDIRALFQGPPRGYGFFEGFVVIAVPPLDQGVPIELDVVAFHSHIDRPENAVEPGSDAEGIDVERYDPIRIFGVPDPSWPAVQPGPLAAQRGEAISVK